jgi:transposase
MESVAYVGMDVDKKKIAMAVVAGYEAQPRVQRIVPNNLAALRKFFGELTEQYENVTACYEAGACGFELYRRVTDINVACAVVAPTSIPRKTNDRIKTDRRDAVKLAIEFRNGNLSPVYVPSRRDEAARDYLRLYEDVKMDLRTAKQRLVHFLNRHEIRYESGKKTWDRSVLAMASVTGSLIRRWTEKRLMSISPTWDTWKRSAGGSRSRSMRSLQNHNMKNPSHVSVHSAGLGR